MAVRPLILSPDDAQACAAWETLRRRSPQRTPFSSVVYARALRDVLGLPFRLHAVGDGASLRAGVLAFERVRGPLRQVFVPPATPYTPLLTADATAEDTSAFLEALAGAYASVALHLHPSTVDVRPWQWQGWRAAPLYTYLLPLAPPDDLVTRWSAGARRVFRREADAFEVREAPGAAADVARLCVESYARHGRRFILPETRLAALVERLRADASARLFTATRPEADAPEAAVAFLVEGDTAYYWIAGSRPGAAMTVLLGHALGALHADGVTQLDFVGANTPSIAEFKRRFGPVLAPYFRVTRSAHRWLRVLQGATGRF